MAGDLDRHQRNGSERADEEDVLGDDRLQLGGDVVCSRVHVVGQRGENRARAQGHVGDDVGILVHSDLFLERLVQIDRIDIASTECRQGHTVKIAPLWGAEQTHNRGRDINDLVLRVDQPVPEAGPSTMTNIAV